MWTSAQNEATSRTGFVENVKDLFTFNKAAALESMVEECQEKIMEKVEEVAERSEFVRTHQGCFCCCCHLLTMLLAVVYVVGLVVFAIVCIMAAQQVAEVMEQPPENETALEEHVESWLGSKTPHYNLAGTLSFILRQTCVLLNETATNLFTNLRGTVGNLEGKMNDLKALVIDFRKDNVNEPSNSDGIKNVAESFEKFTTSIENLREKVAPMPSQLIAKITGELNFAAQIDSFQANISETLNGVKPKVEELTANVK
ncbi:hypothetical protein TSMEX_011275, partial [Taenia solium]|eukprot:TsM_000617700 transcript=TsM_000617700 gene=TsM_000617700